MSDFKDERVAFGASCTWWDLIQNVKLSPPPYQLPVCPFCGSTLFEAPSLDSWFKDVGEHAKLIKDPKYPDFIEWLQGKCFPTHEIAREQFDGETKGLYDNIH